MRPCISIRGSVRPSVGWSVRSSVGWSISPSVSQSVCPSVRPSIHLSIGPSVCPLVHPSRTRFFHSRNCFFPTCTMATKWSRNTCMHTRMHTRMLTHTHWHTHTNARPTVGWNCIKSTHSNHRQKPFSHELRSEWMGEQANERMSAAAVRVNKRADEWMAKYSMRQFHCHSTVIQDRLKIGQKYSIVPSARGRVSEPASQRMNAAARERSERVSEWCEQTSERMSKWLIINRWREIETHTHRNIHTNKSFFFLLFESRELSF